MTLPAFTTLDQMAHGADAIRGMMIDTFSKSELLRTLPFKNVGKSAGEPYSTTAILPSTAARGLNEDLTASQGGFSSGFEPARIYGTRMKTDRAAERMGQHDPGQQLQSHTRSIRLTLESDFITGDPDTSPKRVVGLQWFAENSNATADTSISAGSTSGGAALSYGAMRDNVDNCYGENRIIVCSKATRNLLTGGLVNTGVGGYITQDKDDFGRRITMFDGLPIISVDRDILDAKLLGFSEAASSGANTATSLYIIGLGPDAYYPFQVDGGISNPVVGPNGVWEESDLEWILGTVRVHPRSVVRVKHIGNLAMVA